MRIEASRNNENQESIVEPRSGGRVGAPWSARYELDMLTAIHAQPCVFDARSRCAESVELLAGVAELDVDQVPPMCLEIAQLCGRLPLCLNIVGRYRGGEGCSLSHSDTT